MNRQHVLLAIVTLGSLSCEKLTDPVSPQLEHVAAVYLSPKPDTVFLSISSTQAEQWSVALKGIVVNTSRKTMTNSGVMTTVDFTITLVDSVVKDLSTSQASWFADRTDVVSVDRGVITARQPGIAVVWAVYNGVRSDFLSINVRSIAEAPGLTVDPPEFKLTFQNTVRVSGMVQSHFSTAKLVLTEQAGKFPQQTINYGSDGTFGLDIAGLLPGLSTIVVTASHQTDPGLFTKRIKHVYYYQMNSPEADSIIGHWRGTIGDRILDFYIDRSVIPGRYDIRGTVDIRFPGYGLIRGIQLPGIVNKDGTLSASMTQSVEGFSITGTLEGSFRATASADGSLSAVAKRSGWIDLGARESWKATKIGN